MYIDRRHRYFVYALIVVATIMITEFVLPGLAWWQRWLFIYPPVGLAAYGLAHFMGWYVDPPTDDWDAMTPEQREQHRFGPR